MNKQAAVFLFVANIHVMMAQEIDSVTFEYARVFRTQTIIRAYDEDGSTENLKELHKSYSSFFTDSDYNSFFFKIIKPISNSFSEKK